MVDRTYDIISKDDDILARDVPEKNLVTFLNALIDNGYKCVIVREYEEDERIMQEMTKIATKKVGEVKSLFNEFGYIETSK